MTDPSQLLPVVDGEVSLGDADFGPVMTDSLQRLTQGEPILITGAHRTQDGDTVTVVGDASLLGASVSATVVAQALESGAKLNARFGLPSGWRFSSSFTELPDFTGGGDKNPEAPQTNLLDRLTIETPAFLITTTEGDHDPVTGAVMKPGVSFAGDFRPSGLLGLIGTLVPKEVDQMPLAGPVLIALPDETTPPLPKPPQIVMPWDTTWPTPGINIFADIGKTTLGKALGLEGVGVDFYSPTDATWMGANPSYAPIVAGTAKLSIPSADISVGVTLLGALAPNHVSIVGAFSGVNFGRLEDMVDAVGGSDLPTVLPGDIQSRLAQTLGKISLLNTKLDIGPGFAVQSVSMAIGIPDLDTEVLPNFTIKSLIASFNVADPFGSGRAISVTIDGATTLFDAPFDIELAYPEISARASLAQPVQIQLSRVADYIGFSVPDELPALSLEMLEFYADKAGALGFKMAMAQNPRWTIDLGPTTLTIADVEASIVRPAGGSATAQFGGALTLAGVTLTMNYQSPGDFLLRSEFPEISLVGLARDLTGSRLDFLPSSFDIKLLDNVVMIQKSGANLVFLLVTDIDGLGWVGFEARRADEGWGFAFGLDLVEPRLSSLPGLSALAPLEAVFHMDELLLLVASFDDPAFQFVPASAFDTPALPPGPGVQIDKGGVIKGLNAYGKWTLDTSAPDQKLLRELLGLKTVLEITLQVGVNPEQNSALFLSIDTTLCGMPLTGKFGGRILNGDVSLFIAGTLQTHIGHEDQSWLLALQVYPNGVLFVAGMKGTITFEGIQLSNLGLVIGSDWEAIPSVGVTGAITAGNFHSSVAVFFNSVDPSQSLLAGSISDLDLADVVDAFTAGSTPQEILSVLEEIGLKGTQAFTLPSSVADSLDNIDIPAVSAAFAAAKVPLPTSSAQVLINVGTPGQQWFVTNLANEMRHYTAKKTLSGITVTLDPQIYLAPAKVQIADTTYSQGFFVNSGLDVLTFEASATVNIDTSNGIAVDGEMTQIVIGAPQLFSIRNTAGDGGPKVSISTYTQPTLTGPYKDPHALIDGQLTMLGLSRQLYVSLSTGGFIFKVAGNFIVGVDYDLNGSFTGITSLEVGGSIKLGVGTIDLGPLGKINVGTYVMAAVDIGVSSEKMWANFAVGLSFMGNSWSTSISLNVTSQTLKDLLSAAVDQIKEWLLQLFKDVNAWARAVASKVVELAEDVAKVLTDFYHLTAEEAQKVLDAIGSFAGGCAATAAQLAA
ncbi:MAG TPA: hypothetical protein VHS81_05200 [Caulobacteraceae bacterium]|nr:hypothetical protein [Caulobacteraceae bacterium]